MNPHHESQAAVQPPPAEASSDITVSVFCITYNHATFVSETLEGIVRQQTNFKFEVIVHDDASTDETVEIIRDYAARYPQLIRTIFQKENQCSKGDFEPLCYATSCARGRYVAICEGDDKWTDCRKLQIQFDGLEAHQGIEICFHPAKLYTNGEDTESLYGFNGNAIAVVPPQRMIGGMVVPTASIMVSKRALQSLPKWFYSDAPVGDYYLRVIASAPNGALYVPETMCVYRAHNPGSWSALVNAEPKKFLMNNERHLAVCELLDEHLGRQYSSEIAQFRSRLLIGRMVVFLKTGEFKGLIVDSRRLIGDPVSLLRTLMLILKTVVQKPFQSWQTVSRNFSYAWSAKSGQKNKW